ncbi:MAG: hypothetical protein MI920_18780 [Kiloniellales bacterium]|nr:hypothetical protein [Kiloniellales bacterium]
MLQSDGDGVPSASDQALPSDGAELVTRAEFARRMDVSRAAVTKAIGQGRLHGQALAKAKRLRWAVAAEQWRANRDPQASLDDDPESGEAEGESLAYRTEKAMTERVKRQLAEIELGRAQDRYRDKDEVARAEATCGRRIAQQLDLIESWADELAVETDPMKLRRLLRTRVWALRKAIADELQRLAEEGGGDEAYLDA